MTNSGSQLSLPSQHSRVDLDDPAGACRSSRRKAKVWGFKRPSIFARFIDAAIAGYRRNNAKVREIIPADRLLVFNVADGWAPLCDFLGVPVPDVAFPHKNVRREFWEHFGGEPAMA